jgi:hypothetical protein
MRWDRRESAQNSCDQNNGDQEVGTAMKRHGVGYRVAWAVVAVTIALAQPALAQVSPGVSGPPPSSPVKPAPQLTEDKKEKLRELIKKANVDHAARMEFEVKLGAEVPRNLHFYPLPKEIAESVPEYSDFFYVVAREQIVVIDPVNYRIVALLPV